MLNRRDAPKLAALAPAGAAAASIAGRAAEAAAADSAPIIKRYSVLGRTGARVSDLCLGGGSLAEARRWWPAPSRWA